MITFPRDDTHAKTHEGKTLPADAVVADNDYVSGSIVTAVHANAVACSPPQTYIFVSNCNRPGDIPIIA